MWRCADISSHICGGARFLGADRKSIIPIPDPRFFSLSLSLSLSPTSPPLLLLPLSALFAGRAGHHAALFDLAEPAIHVIARSSADSVAMAVQSRG